jgi:predicted ATPase
MLLKSFTVQHYKSITNVDCKDLQPITIFVGSNAAGKSNIIDALRFLRDAIAHGLDHAISTRGGIEVIRQYSPTRPFHITLKVELLQDSGEHAEKTAFYELKIASLEGGNYKVDKEDAAWYDLDVDEKEGELFSKGLRSRAFTRNAKGEVKIDNKLHKYIVPPDQLAVGASRIAFRSIAFPIVNSLSRLRFSALFPNTLRIPARPDTDRNLKESGENWASILKTLRQTDRGRNAIKRILEMMRLVMPSLQDVTVKGVGGYLVPQFLVKDSEKLRKHYFDPVQLSDGTLRIFGILLNLYQIPPPKFLAIEEPELTVHPGILSMLADAFKEASVNSQIFITSHSPYLVDYFNAKQILVVNLINGETRVDTIKKSQIESVKEHLTSIKELMMMEGLQPEE